MKSSNQIRRIRYVLVMIFMAGILALLPPASDLQPAMASTQKTAAAKKKKKKKAKNIVRTGFVRIKGKYYYYGADHKVKTGWFSVRGKKYFGKRKGANKGSLFSGWHTIDGKEYYFSPKKKKGAFGAAYAGCTRKVNGISCKFDGDGAFVKCRFAKKRGGFVNRIGEMARDNQRKNNILASVVVAQAILETGYGRVIPHNNLFGIYGGRYGSERASMEGYNSYIRTYFPGLIGCRSYYHYATRIGSGGYAQAYGYGRALIQIIRRDGLTRFSR